MALLPAICTNLCHLHASMTTSYNESETLVGILNKKSHARTPPEKLTESKYPGREPGTCILCIFKMLQGDSDMSCFFVH